MEVEEESDEEEDYLRKAYAKRLQNNK